MLTKEIVLARVREKHDNFYTYPKFEYVNKRTKCIISWKAIISSRTMACRPTWLGLLLAHKSKIATSY